jgi:rRNA maturation protein Nop10
MSKQKQPKKNKYPLLRCPQCGFEIRPTMHGWAFASSAKTVCQPGEETLYAHPFQVVDED